MDQRYQQHLLRGVSPTRFSFFDSTFDRYYRRHRIAIPYVPENDVSIDEDDESPAQPTRDSVCSKPFVILDIMWHLAFVVVSLFVLSTTVQERPSTPLRLWIGGYAFQCLLHVGFIWAQHRRPSHDVRVQDFHLDWASRFFSLCNYSFIKKLDRVNTVASSIWWVVGFYWIVMGGQSLLQDSPRLYWLLVVFLAFDVFFVIFCVIMACIIFCIVFFVLFVCFPIIAAVAYAMTIGEGACDSVIMALPKYTYRRPDCDSADELALHSEDSECCICLYGYVDGVELCKLPCDHHFHHKCISKWLRINATCPLCKFNILRADTLV